MDVIDVATKEVQLVAMSASVPTCSGLTVFMFAAGGVPQGRQAVADFSGKRFLVH
jgi:hypothetical protein